MNWELGNLASTFISVRIKISIFSSRRDLSWSNFPDKELISKCPVINLSTFFILSWLKLVNVSQGSSRPIELLPNLFETFEACSEVFMLLLNSEARWFYLFKLQKTLLASLPWFHQVKPIFKQLISVNIPIVCVL